MWMNVVRSAGHVLEYYSYEISYFCPDEGTQYGQMFVFPVSRLQMSESRISEFPEDSLFVDSADSVRSAGNEYRTLSEMGKVEYD